VRNHEDTVRRIIAVLVAPLATGVVYALVYGVLFLFQTESFSGSVLLATALAIALWSGVASVAAFAMTLLVGMPLEISFERRGRGDLGDIVRLGAILGALPFVLFDAYVVFTELSHHATIAAATGLFKDLPRALGLAALGASCGGASAWTYWSILHWR
jgi:hypothetical protein